MPKEILWTAKQVAHYLGLSEYTVYVGAAGTRDIPRIKMGRAVRWKASDVMAWLEERHSWAKRRIDRRLGKVRAS